MQKHIETSVDREYLSCCCCDYRNRGAACEVLEVALIFQPSLRTLLPIFSLLEVQCFQRLALSVFVLVCLGGRGNF
jgi:hypothetical protein